MSAPQKSSRWGSFLSQAVAGVEARLDNILADDDTPKEQEKPAAPQPQPRSATPSKSNNDRLQERLARAVAARNASSSARQSIDAASVSSSPRPSIDATRLPAASSPRSSLSADTPTTAAAIATAAVDATAVVDATTTIAATTTERPITPAAPETAEPLQPDSTPPDTNFPPDVSLDPPIQRDEGESDSSNLYQQRITLLEKTLEYTQTQHQEELHAHVERVDALQAKLQYLAKEAAQNARSSTANAPAGSPERKMAEKDDQIAQLLLEGQKLTSTEQKHRTIIKKLRAQLATTEKEINDHKLSRQKNEADLASLRKRLDDSTDLERANQNMQSLLTQSRKEADKLKSDLDTKDRLIADLKSELQDESEKVKSLATAANDHAREVGQKRLKDLEDTVASLEIEKGLVADRAKVQIAEHKERADRASEHARAVELELKGEVQILESKLEALRARAEEASSSAVGDAQAKLLRQIETLQTQYSIASENWQGMEASLEARAVALEKERDEAIRRESEMRRKARETASRVKLQEEELEEMRNQLPKVQRDLKSYQSQLDLLKTRAEQAEKALAEARAEAAKSQEKGDRTDHDRRNWPDEGPAALYRNPTRPESPLLTAPLRTFSGDNFLGLQSYPARLRKTSAPSSNGEPSPSEHRPLSARRPSVQPPVRSPSMFTSMPTPSVATPPSLAGGFDYIASPPTLTADRDDTLDGLERPASPQNVLHDITSVSTMTAGPSVQLVEKLSAAIRRLESEKVAAKEELARISSQRDDARGQIVTLMRESEAAKAATERAAKLEKEVGQLNERYQTTLEMLGEKSELVEELRADVQDVKAMYRDLVERTIK
ncbi:hypothetical protein F5Y16DRAFT_194466 [Xylariaceae sp. FL0255]|nr:hypothetical protein F5Y16DRAFT_194466 [Xylariaceae sp. FL0255]